MGKLTRNRGQLMIFRTAWRRSFLVTSTFADTDRDGRKSLRYSIFHRIHSGRRDPEKEGD